MRHKNPWPILALVMFLAGCPARAENGDLKSRLDREFARLSDDDVTVRDAAVDAITKEGRPAEVYVRGRIETERSPEAVGRLHDCLERIDVKSLEGLRWEKVVSCSPLQVNPTRLALSPDGRFLASDANDEEVFVMEVDTGRVVLRANTKGCPASLAFSPDGKLLAACAEGVGLWSTADWTPVEPLTEEELTPGVRLSKAANGSEVCIAMSRRESSPRITWVSGKGGPGRTVVPAGSELLGRSADGSRLVSLDTTRFYDPHDISRVTLHVLRSGSDPPQKKIELGDFPPDERTLSIAIDADLETVAFVRDGKAFEVNIGSGVESAPFAEGSVVISRTDKGWVTADVHGALAWWRDGKKVREFASRVPFPDRLVVSGSTLFIHGNEGGDRNHGGTDRVAVLVAENEEPLVPCAVGEFELPEGSSAALVNLEDGEALVVRGGAIVSRIPRSPSSRRGHRYLPFAMEGDRLCWSSDHELVARDVSTGKDHGLATPHRHFLNSLFWGRDGIVAGYDWEFSWGAALIGESGEVQQLTREETDLALRRGQARPSLQLAAPENDWAVSADGLRQVEAEAHKIVVRTVAGGGELLSIPREPGNGEADQADLFLTLSADGRFFAWRTSPKGPVEVWDVDAKKRQFEVKPDKGLSAIDVSRGGRLVTAREEPLFGSAVRIKYVASDQFGEILTEEGDSRGPTQIPILQHGRWLVDLTRKGTLYVANVDGKAEPREIELPDASKTYLRFLLPAKDGDRFVVQLGRAGFAAVSARDGLLTYIEGNPIGPSAGTLADGTEAILSDHGLILLGAACWKPSWEDPKLRGESLAVSPDGLRIAVARRCEVTIYARR